MGVRRGGAPLGVCRAAGVPLQGQREEVSQPVLQEAAAQQARPVRRAIRRLQDVLGGVVLVGFIYYLFEHRDEAEEVLRASSDDLAVLTGLVLVTLGLNLIQNVALIRRLGVPLTWAEGFVLTFATNFGNYLPMRAGNLIVAHYLKSVHRLSYAHYGSLFGVRLLITLFGIGLLGSTATLIIWLGLGRLSLTLLIMFGGLMVSAVLVWLVPLPKSKEGGGRLRRSIDAAILGATQLQRDPALGALVLTTIVLQQATLVARFYFGTRALGSHPPLAYLMLLSPVASLASLAAFTPGALGMREAAMGAATYAVGATFSSGMRIGTLDRSVLFGVVSLFGVFCFPYAWFKLRRAERHELSAGSA